jgi:HD-like signal output (HDOD) protein
LLHDLGQVVYFKQDRVRYSQLFGKAKGPDDPSISDYELEYYDIDHGSLGAILTKEWRLPAELSAAVRRHHDSCGAGQPLIAAVAMADMLAKQAQIGHDGDNKITADVPHLQLLLKMGPEEFEELTVLAKAKRSDVEEFFNLNMNN